MTVTCGLQTVICSKDRPAQLDLLLRSIKQCVGDWQEHRTSVLYRESDPAYHRAYELLQAEHLGVSFVEETNFRYDIQAITLGNCAEYTQFLTDDDVYLRPFSLADPEFVEFILRPNIIALVLRMGRSMDRCYTENLVVEIPEFRPPGTWEWRKHPCDWGYPHSVDGTIWRTSTIRRVLAHAEYDSPSHLEPCLLAAMTAPLALCYDKPRLVSIPNNSVQDAVRPNRHAGGDPLAMNERFLAGERIAWEPLRGLDPPSPHVEVEYEWETK